VNTCTPGTTGEILAHRRAGERAATFRAGDWVLRDSDGLEELVQIDECLDDDQYAVRYEGADTTYIVPGDRLSARPARRTTAPDWIAAAQQRQAADTAVAAIQLLDIAGQLLAKADELWESTRHPGLTDRSLTVQQAAHVARDTSRAVVLAARLAKDLAQAEAGVIHRRYS
jgi:hypothetical protein